MRLSRPIVIPEGAKLTEAPSRVARANRFLSVLLPLSKDVTAELTISYSDALALGLVDEQ